MIDTSDITFCATLTLDATMLLPVGVDAVFLRHQPGRGELEPLLEARDGSVELDAALGLRGRGGGGG